MKLAFVILNYKTYEETTECVQSIRDHIDLPPHEYNITIVDNGSDDGSGARIEQLYKDIRNIDYMHLESNIGFARGNNAGIDHVNNSYAPDFLIVLNSDTELFQDDLYEKISREYCHSHFGLLGPMIITADGRCDDSPWKPMTLDQAEKIMANLNKQRRKIQNGTIVFSQAMYKIKNKLGNGAERDELHLHEDFLKYAANVELQGAFLIFSKKAFEFIQGFDPRTFLYYEEQLLYLNAVKHNLPVVYDPRICVFHKCNRAAKKGKRKPREKLLFFNRCCMESMEFVLQELRKSHSDA